MPANLTKTLLCAAALSFGLVSGASAQRGPAIPAASAPPGPDAAFQARAKAAAGTEWTWMYNMLCSQGDVIQTFWGGAFMSVADQDFEPVKAFDNFYFVGLRQAGVWAVKTSAGIILIDSHFAGQTESRLVPSLRKAGLDPAQVKYVIVTHAHPDHMGGARYFQEKYKAKVIMSAQDWDFADTQRPKDGKPDTVAVRDMVKGDGDTLTLGDTTIRFIFTPGHTPGSLSVVVPVKENGVMHTAAIWGGQDWRDTGWPKVQRDQYMASMTHFREVMKSVKPDVQFETHPFLSALISKLAEMRGRKPGSPNPMIIGNDGFEHYMDVWQNCSGALNARVNAKDMAAPARP